MSHVRTRFAPSPTGFLHVGGVRTALFAWLVARQAKGQFILRLEDTDTVREIEGSAQHIMDSLRWLGIEWDEGPDKPGEFGPYQQSKRLTIYKEWAEQLIARGRAYVDPYTPEQVESFRHQAKNARQPFLFREHRPADSPAWDGSQPLRFKSEPKAYSWHDEVMGTLSAGSEVIDDFILIKTDGYPTYNFAHVIDDYLMQCSYVFRSQEFLASTPKYLNLYEALNFDPPKLATLPYVLGQDGTRKLSKRDGAKDILDYAREGYLPEAMMNFLATLGWNDGTEQEIFSIKELIEKFTLLRVQRSGARFDEQRLLWMNGAHIRRLPLDDLMVRAKDFWPKEAKEKPEAYQKQVLGLIQERLKLLSELPMLTNFFFTDLPVNLALIDTNKQLKKLTHDELRQLLEAAKTSLKTSDFSLGDLTERLNQLLEKTQQKPTVLFSIIRIATTQAPASPSLAETLEVLGKEVVLRRLDDIIAKL